MFLQGMYHVSSRLSLSGRPGTSRSLPSISYGNSQNGIVEYTIPHSLTNAGLQWSTGHFYRL